MYTSIGRKIYNVLVVRHTVIRGETYNISVVGHTKYL